MILSSRVSFFAPIIERSYNLLLAGIAILDSVNLYQGVDQQSVGQDG